VPIGDGASVLRILTVTHFFESHRGGIEIVAGQLARELAELGHECAWAASGGDVPPDDDCVRDIPLKTFDPLERATGLPMPVPMPRAAFKLWRAVGHSDGVVIHDALYATSLIAAVSAWWHRKPTVLIQHIGAIPFSSRLLRGVMRFANWAVTRPMMRAASQTVFISHTVRQQFASMRWRRAPAVLFNGVDTARFHAPSPARISEAKATFGLAADRPTLLFVGRFVEKKGLGVLREIARALPGYDFVMVGAGPIDPAAWQLPNVRVLGALPPPRLAGLYQAVDALVLPSTGEGYPLVIQEAMASGLPVFCGDEAAQADPDAARFLVGLPVDLAAPQECAARFAAEIGKHDLERSVEAAAYAAQTYDWRRSAARISEILSAHAGACALLPV
jgi:alpha-maltose-1-phosphate synthase